MKGRLFAVDALGASVNRSLSENMNLRYTHVPSHLIVSVSEEDIYMIQ
jgi:hypothetical protein